MSSPARARAGRSIGLGLALAGLSGCASFSADGGADAVGRLTRERLGVEPHIQRTPEETRAAQARVAELLAVPLSAERATELALLNNPELQARYAELGIAEADLVRAGQVAGPQIALGRLAGGGLTEIDRGILFDVLGLFTMPRVRELQQQRFGQAQLRAASDTVNVALAARTAYFEAVAAQQMLAYFDQVREAATLSGELARRMQAAGNFSALTRLREQAFESDAILQQARARQRAVAARERLVRLLGLADGQQAFQLPDRLPDLPEALAAPQAVEQAAVDQRLDVRLARAETAATARALGLTQATRFVDVLQAGYQDQAQTGEPLRRGYAVTLELPLFDFGSTRVARAEAVYRQSLHRTAQVALEARSSVREADAAYRAAHELARHYRDDVVPLRKRISDETLLRYNGMLASVFELLADAREQIGSVSAAVEAQRDFWVAQTQLQAALAGGTRATTAP